jgi:hypothetical protein
LQARVTKGALKNRDKILQCVGRLQERSPKARTFVTVAVARQPGMYELRPAYLRAPLGAPFWTTSICVTTPPENTLNEFVDFQKVNSDNAETQAIVTAVIIQQGQLVRFGNRVSRKKAAARKPPAQVFENQDDLSVKHIVASGGLPPGFPDEDR